MAVALLALLAIAAVAIIAVPLLTEARADDVVAEVSTEQRARLALREERDEALAALRELEFDHRTGKIADVDYLPLAAELRARVAQALEALDREAGAGAATPERIAEHG
jgi:Mg/Co/Ni transporter MgtE